MYKLFLNNNYKGMYSMAWITNYAMKHRLKVRKNNTKVPFDNDLTLVKGNEIHLYT